jgi:hypothetical protein
MKLNFNFTITSFDGEPVRDELGIELNAGRACANIILNSQVGGLDISERFGWAQDLYRNSELDLDRAGQEKFKTMMANAPNISLLVRGRIMEVLERKMNLDYKDLTD